MQAGCEGDNDEQSCQMLLNLCVSEGYDGGGTYNQLCNRLKN